MRRALAESGPGRLGRPLSAAERAEVGDLLRNRADAEAARAVQRTQIAEAMSNTEQAIAIGERIQYPKLVGYASFFMSITLEISSVVNDDATHLAAPAVVDRAVEAPTIVICRRRLED